MRTTKIAPAAPMLTAWGCPKEYASIPGCTQGEPDIRFSQIYHAQTYGAYHKKREKGNGLHVRCLISPFFEHIKS